MSVFTRKITVRSVGACWPSQANVEFIEFPFISSLIVTFCNKLDICIWHAASDISHQLGILSWQLLISP